MINLYIDESGSMTHNNLEMNNNFVICIVRVYDHEKLAIATKNFVSHHKKEIMEVDNNHIMFDDKGRVITSHTTSPVPFIMIGENYSLHDGKLGDIAPTILELLNLEIPYEMTGESLIDKI